MYAATSRYNLEQGICGNNRVMKVEVPDVSVLLPKASSAVFRLVMLQQIELSGTEFSWQLRVNINMLITPGDDSYKKRHTSKRGYLRKT